MFHSDYSERFVFLQLIDSKYSYAIESDFALRFAIFMLLKSLSLSRKVVRFKKFMIDGFKLRMIYQTDPQLGLFNISFINFPFINQLFLLCIMNYVTTQHNGFHFVTESTIFWLRFTISQIKVCIEYFLIVPFFHWEAIFWQNIAYQLIYFFQSLNIYNHFLRFSLRVSTESSEYCARPQTAAARGLVLPTRGLAARQTAGAS